MHRYFSDINSNSNVGLSRRLIAWQKFYRVWLVKKFPKQFVCNKSDKWFRKPWLDLGTYWNGIPLGWLWNFFFINMSKKISSRQWANILKFIGATNIIFIFLIATPLHDLGTISIILTLFGLFTITVFILMSKLHLLKFCCIICLLTYYCFFSVFGLGYLGLSVIMQKVYIISSMLLVLGLEYFTKYEDFIPIKSGAHKIQATNR